MEIIFVPILLLVFIGIISKLINGIADSTSDFIYYSIHKHDDES